MDAYVFITSRMGGSMAGKGRDGCVRLQDGASTCGKSGAKSLTLPAAWFMFGKIFNTG